MSGRLRDAIESLKISLWSAESLDARLLLAEALLGTGETAEAQVHAERALQLAPESDRWPGRCSSGFAPTHGADTLVIHSSSVQIAGAGANCARDLAVLVSVTSRRRDPGLPARRVPVLGARMAHELHDDGFHEIQLSGKQLVFLFMATTVVSIVIFLCGVLVGRGVQNARGCIASPSAAEPARREAADDDDAATAPATGEPTPVAGLSYPASLPARQGDPATGRARCSRRDDRRRPRSLPRSRRLSRPPPPPKDAAKDRAAKESPTEAPKEAPRPPHRRPPRRRPRPRRLPPRTAGSPCRSPPSRTGPRPMPSRSDCRRRGYKAYVVAPSAGGQVIYKVRVGVNMQRQEADKVMRRLQNEEKFKPWITR